MPLSKFIFSTGHYRGFITPRFPALVVIFTDCNDNYTMPNEQAKKTVVIVGGGISGLTTGIYLLDNGYDVHIYEKHSIAGGACTGWVREGQYIDGCAHWIIGTNPDSCLRPIWEHIGAFDDAIRIYPTTSLTTFHFKDGPITFHADLQKLEEELLAMSPQDKRQIKSFIRTIKNYTHIKIPVSKPMERMNPFEFTAFGLSMIKAAIPFAKYKKVSVGEYASKFKDKRIGDLFIRFMGDYYNMHSLFYILQGFCTNDAGIMEGGSLKMATSVAKTFESRGGTIHLNSPVKRIEVEGKKAKGITLENGEFIPADFVVASTDSNETFQKLLPDVKMPKFFSDRYEQKDGYKLLSAFQFSFQTTLDLSEAPRMSDFLVEPFNIGPQTITHYGVRNFSFDKTLSRGKKTLLTILLPTHEETYDYLASLSKEEYVAEKERLGRKFLALLEKDLGAKPGEIKLLDVATPLTYTRYTNAFKGAYMSFVTTKHAKGLMEQTILRGYKNILIGGQWLMPPGGLPIAIMIGKHAAYNLCYLDKKPFKNLETKKAKGLLKTKIA